MDEREEWRPVPACRWFGVPAGVFEGSSLGNVRTADRTLSDGRAAGGVLLSPVPDRDGYLRVKHQGRWFSVAVLVLLAFHGPPEARHLGDSNQGNKPTELAWGSRRDNEQDKRDKGKVGQRPVPVRRITRTRSA